MAAEVRSYPLELALSPPIGETRRVSRTEAGVAIIGLFLLEIYHLKWIWWEHWKCRSCGIQNKSCACALPRWFKYL